VVILLHGWSATADLNWHPYFDTLAMHFRVIALDHRGHGRGIRHESPFLLEDCADDVAALARVLGVDRPIVVGYSMGGAIAQLLWRRHPDLVGGLVFCSTSAAFGSTARLRLLFRAAGGVSAVRASGTVSTVANSAIGVVARWNGLRRETTWGIDELARHDWGKLVEAGHQLGRYDARSWIDTISVPTTVIATMNDEVVATRHQISLAQSIPDATLRHLPGGHHRCVTHPERFSSMLVGACREVAARSSVSGVSVTTAIAS
jgi:3-oxoadipate enol-lactonase